ncbi:histidine kinase [Sphingomonas sp. HMWF008]|nr:histidine kinase [Sphingomonas sp. HMWF008]
MADQFANPRAGATRADAGQRNMRLLIQLRWIAVGGQLVTIAAVQLVMKIDLPLAPLLGAVAVLVFVNIASLPLLRQRTAVTNAELTAALLFDVAALAWQLHFTGGVANPFASLFLLQVVLSAILLRPVSAWGIVAATLLALGGLSIAPVALALTPDFRADPLRLYLAGSLVCFVLIAVLLVVFVTRISRNLSARDASLAAARQRAAEEDHIVRMGLLASGAAHELGTPLSTLSVILGDLKHLPPTTRAADLAEDVAEMETAVARCKAIVGGILMSAGEARGEAPKPTSVRAFLTGIVEEWQSSRLAGTVEFADHFGEDVAIVADPALKQVIGNVIDNAADFSPEWIGITAWRFEDSLALEIADRGPGFSSEILSSFGQPYRSTKGRPGGGLGLFLLVNVIRKLGGDAEAGNRDAGGAFVRIMLPLRSLAFSRESVQ